jgi:hypothetical protein
MDAMNKTVLTLLCCLLKRMYRAFILRSLQPVTVHSSNTETSHLPVAYLEILHVQMCDRRRRRRRIVVKSIIFWVVMPCSSETAQRFRVMYHLHL